MSAGGLFTLRASSPGPTAPRGRAVRLSPTPSTWVRRRSITAPRIERMKGNDIRPRDLTLLAERLLDAWFEHRVILWIADFGRRGLPGPTVSRGGNLMPVGAANSDPAPRMGEPIPTLKPVGSDIAFQSSLSSPLPPS